LIRNTPKISVIIPVFNSAAYLAHCITSLVSQTLEEIEFIFINDGSSDNSLGILKEFAQKDRRIIIINQQNEGCANARNKGLEAANAPFIGFVDSDDFIAPQMYQVMYDAMIQNDVDFVCCGAHMNPDSSTPEFILKDQTTNYEMHYNGKTNSKDIFFSHNCALWNKLFKKELIVKYHLAFDTGFSSYEDSEFVWSYWCIAESAYFTKEKLYYYLIRDSGIMGKSFRRQMGIQGIDKIKICENFYYFLHEYTIFEANKYYFWNCYLESIYCSYGWTEPDVMREHGIPLIKNFIKGKDISYLSEENYFHLHCFSKIGEDEILLVKKCRFLCFFKEERWWRINDLSVTNDLYFFNVRISDKHARLLRSIYKLIKTNFSPMGLVKKSIKCILPYGLVKLVQKMKGKK
jgi:glycosyltransferase involved in cell wall biosynthesis